MTQLVFVLLLLASLSAATPGSPLLSFTGTTGAKPSNGAGIPLQIGFSFTVPQGHAVIVSQLGAFLHPLSPGLYVPIGLFSRSPWKMLANATIQQGNYAYQWATPLQGEVLLTNGSYAVVGFYTNNPPTWGGVAPSVYNASVYDAYTTNSASPAPKLELKNAVGLPTVEPLNPNNTANHLVSANAWILRCSASCQSCAPDQPQTCTACAAPFSLMGGRCCDPSCTSCLPYTTAATRHLCSSCGGATYPSQASPPFSCSPCNSKCASCFGGLDTQCGSCANGNYLSAPMTCAACDSSCLTCSSATTCLSCDTSKYNYDSVNKRCCDLNCATCAAGQPTTCLSCPAGQTLVGSICCDNSCATCQVAAGTAASSLCLTCPTGFHLSGGISPGPCVANGVSSTGQQQASSTGSFQGSSSTAGTGTTGAAASESIGQKIANLKYALIPIVIALLAVVILVPTLIICYCECCRNVKDSCADNCSCCTRGPPRQAADPFRTAQTNPDDDQFDKWSSTLKIQNTELAIR